jgi:pimeloyl-ACP methyl ester carboxylesterase
MAFNDEIGALGRVAGDAADRLATTPVQGVHAAITERVFRNIGPAALPARALHDGISTAVYAGVRAGVATGARVGALVAKARGTDPEVVSRTRRGSQLQSIVNGLIGHELALENDPLAMQMGFWRHGLPVALDDIEIPTRKLVVFVHGLFETEQSWTTGDDVCYGDQLSDAWTALYVRYNTGLPIIENGRRLSRLLDELVADRHVGQIALVGHSMGGLVVRVAGAEESSWRRHLTHVACLGTPNQGAPIADMVHRAAGLLSQLPEAAPFGAILDQRSAGIRDLRRGIDAGPLLDGVHHLFLGATFTADPKHPIGLLIGDFLVREGSARGPRDVEVDVEDCVHLGGLTHFKLLNHERVYEHLAGFLERPVRERRALSA